MEIVFDSVSNEVRAVWTTVHGTTKDTVPNAGLDIPTPSKVIVPPNARSFKIHLGVRCRPTAHFMLVPRSSMGSKTTLRQANSIGIIDRDYRGELILVVDNIGGKQHVVEPGDRLCQIVDFQGRQISWSFGDVETLETTRGENGLGSSGK